MDDYNFTCMSDRRIELNIVDFLGLFFKTWPLLQSFITVFSMQGLEMKMEII
jgi:hypothetical protein